MAEDIGGIKDAGPWIEKANPTYTVLVDQQHLIASLYGMVNVPTAVWINEQGRIVRPNETAFIDNRYKSMHGIDAKPYLDGLRDWLDKGDKSAFAMTPEQLRKRLTPPEPSAIQADAYFRLAQFMVASGLNREAIPYFKEAQRLRPDDWNYKRQAWLLTDAQKDYGTSFAEEVKKLNGKPYYPPLDLPKQK